MTMKEALIVIDYTYDFVADDGKLTCGKPGQEIEQRIIELTQSFIAAGKFVVMAVDGHHENDPYHPESKLFPPHNLFGTKGRELYGGLADVYRKSADAIYWMDKTRYSAFAGTDLELRLRARQIDTLHLVGVCTDICVLHTAVDAYNKGFSIVVHKDAVQSFNPAGHEWALGHFAGSLGAAVVEKEIEG
ncbi:cysteine hydrolase [Brevibacillus fluminis]|uniref:Cysteine hydrolase n=1 Tax=Brevibacillus fluminis TaxID=511487 RepID=A0A3M8D983_9BACL|nr:isochorismatase family cysteine hydrolase [Brevibacillus fluminis]RNB84453.1 cysteine hydrolase [Brevibacillus fluminis]